MSEKQNSSFDFSNHSDLYKTIVETTNEGIWVIDQNSHTTFANKRMAEILDCSVEFMLGKTIFDFMDEEGVKITLENIERRKKGLAELHEFKLFSKKKEVVWVRMNTSPILKDGVYHGAFAMVSDISAAKEKEERQIEVQQKYVSLFEDNPVPTWEEDFSQVKIYIDKLKEQGVRDFRKFFSENNEELIKCVSGLIVNDVNAAVLELNDADSKEYMLRNYRKLINRKSADYAIEQCVAIAENKTTCEFDAELKTFNGKKRYVHLKWSVVKGYEHNYKKVYLTTTDLTARILEENYKLQTSVLEKEVLLKEIHHRVKNNLQIIMSLLNLQSRTIEDEKMQDVFEMSLSRIKSMATVHELLYRSNDFSQINYLDYLNMLIFPLVQSMQSDGFKIDINLDVKNVELNINTSIPLGLLITEIVTNSIKHGLNQRNGAIYIRIIETSRPSFVLEIGDDGIGLPKDLNIDDTDTLGLQLVSTLTDQLMGSIELEHSRPGTHYKIQFQELTNQSMK